MARRCLHATWSVWSYAIGMADVSCGCCHRRRPGVFMSLRSFAAPNNEFLGMQRYVDQNALLCSVQSVRRPCARRTGQRSAALRSPGRAGLHSLYLSRAFHVQIWTDHLMMKFWRSLFYMECTDDFSVCISVLLAIAPWDLCGSKHYLSTSRNDMKPQAIVLSPLSPW